ncbi:uncharacterized protein LOC112560306 isoform X2 [Pomacea canaliculata]|uniref:uncharacterized protein LOC112560306 isoform X2 n=1 Tax=Pomacea canaliculata TaxID=400727 RepID=UPI000D73002A|nr:uncharacterized protein LOC112560306 isoform X2 [Pomacea canaliculata]
MAVALVKNLAKVGVGAGAIYVTIQQGIWSTDTKQGYQVLNSVRSSVLPTASEYVSKIPSAEQMCISATQTWNKGVTKVFEGVAEVPEYGKKVVTYTKDSVCQLVRGK